MDLHFTLMPGSQRLDAVEAAARQRREDSQLRLAKLTNRVDPDEGGKKKRKKRAYSY